MKLTWLFVIFLLVLVAVFSVQNAEPMTVHFLGWQFSMSAALVIQLAAVLGALVGLVCGARSRRPARRTQPEEPTLASPPPSPAHEPSPIERHL